MEIKRDLTTSEFAKLAGHKDNSAARHLLRRGVFPGAYKRDGRWFIPAKKAEAWLAYQRIQKQR